MASCTWPRLAASAAETVKDFRRYSVGVRLSICDDTFVLIVGAVPANVPYPNGAWPVRQATSLKAAACQGVPAPRCGTPALSHWSNRSDAPATTSLMTMSACEKVAATN